MRKHWKCEKCGLNICCDDKKVLKEHIIDNDTDEVLCGKYVFIGICDQQEKHGGYGRRLVANGDIKF